MSMDYEQGHYQARLRDVIAHTEVMSIFFLRIGQSLIFDFRPDDVSPPLVSIEPMVESPYDRLLSFRSLRSEMPLPDELTLAPWTSRVNAFKREGILQLLLDRCESVGGAELKTAAEGSYQMLVMLEKQGLRDMVRGVGMASLWRSDDPSGDSGSNE